MWREFIGRLTTECEFAPPATASELAWAEEKLGVAFSEGLRQLLAESNGVTGEHGLCLIWHVQRIEADNMAFRTNRDFREFYMPFDHLLFFADAGTGDQFAYPVLAGEVRRPDVFVWDHETDNRNWVAPSLALYLEWWLVGRIEL